VFAGIKLVNPVYWQIPYSIVYASIPNPRLVGKIQPIKPQIYSKVESLPAENKGHGKFVLLNHKQTKMYHGDNKKVNQIAQSA
jgi:hypothetical protein